MSIFGRERTGIIAHALEVPSIDEAVPSVLSTATFAAG